MKKVVIEVCLLVILAVVSCIVIYNKFGNTEKIIISEDENKFKQVYESLNGQKNRNDEKYVEVKVPENNGVIYTSVSEIEKILKDGTGVIYLGSHELNNARSIIEVLFASKSSTDLDNIYYLDIYDMRDEQSLVDGEVTIDKEGTKDYDKLLKLLNKYLNVYDGLDKEDIKRIYIPTVIFVVDGEITHVETIKKVADESKVLSSDEKNALASIYMKYMAEVASGVCDEKC